ncbi:MAG: molybdenum cofactor biosynthesis protein [Euryarchaeota archaeon]|nr:molybdenum cofactor biosynthesis protein [Euryarchaeota archaeon]
MKPLASLIPLEEAKALVDRHVRPVERTEKVPLQSLLSRVLAEDIVSRIDVPPYDRSAMDGYAVRAVDTFQAGKFEPIELDCIGVVNAGDIPRMEIERGECAQISTGAMIPQGTDAVVMVENTERSGKKIQVYRSVPPGSNLSKRGEDIREGAVVLRKGELLTPSKVGVLAALGLAEVEVFVMPTVHVIPTGNEVSEVGRELRKGQVYDINSHTLASILRESGCVPVPHPVVEDTREVLASILAETQGGDMIVLSGGSSAGERDVLEQVVSSMGKVIFHGVQIKPGKPTIFGVIGSTPIFGMPGYPTACLTNGYVFLLPAARKMARLPPKRDIVGSFPLARKYAATLGRHQFLTVRVENGEAHPVFKESGAITSIAHADGWIEVPPNVDIVEKGTMVEVHFF